MRYFILFSMAILMFSCRMEKSSTTKSMGISDGGVRQVPVMVDLEVGQKKVSGTATAVNSSVSREEAKNNAVADALKQSGADVLVEPQFQIENYMGKTTVTVTGFPGYYKNFRNAQPQDTVWLNQSQLRTSQLMEQPEKKKYTGAIAGFSVLALAALLLAVF